MLFLFYKYLNQFGKQCHIQEKNVSFLTLTEQSVIGFMWHYRSPVATVGNCNKCTEFTLAVEWALNQAQASHVISFILPSDD